MRINRQRTEKAHARVRCGDVVALALRGEVVVVRVVALGVRRGPAGEARGLYGVLDAPEGGLHMAANDCICAGPEGETRSMR